MALSPADGKPIKYRFQEIIAQIAVSLKDGSFIPLIVMNQPAEIGGLVIAYDIDCRRAEPFRVLHRQNHAGIMKTKYRFRRKITRMSDHQGTGSPANIG